MADTQVVAAMQQPAGAHQRLVWLNQNTGYWFYIEDGTKIPKYKKTTTGPAGFAAATAVTIAAAQGGTADSYGWCAVWEKEYGYELNNRIHIFYQSATDDKIYHKYLSTDTDILSSEHTVYTLGLISGNTDGATLAATVTANGDIYFLCTLSGLDRVTYRSQNGGDTWAAIGGDAPWLNTVIMNVLVPWTFWDGVDEDIVLLQQEVTGDTVKAYVLDASTGTWSAGVSLGYAGFFRWGAASEGISVDACMRVSNGKVYVLGSWRDTGTPGGGIALFEVTGTGQGNITVAEKASMLPDIGADYADLFAPVSLCIIQDTAVIHGFCIYDAAGLGQPPHIVHASYDIATNIWSSITQWDSGGNLYQYGICGVKSIPPAGTGIICPIWFYDPADTSQEYWLQNLDSAIYVGGGGGGAGPLVGNVLDITTIT